MSVCQRSSEQPTTFYSPNPPGTLWDRDPIRWMATWSSGNRRSWCNGLRTSPSLPSWKCSMAGNAEKEETRDRETPRSVQVLPKDPSEPLGTCRLKDQRISKRCTFRGTPSHVTLQSVQITLGRLNKGCIHWEARWDEYDMYIRQRMQVRFADVVTGVTHAILLKASLNLWKREGGRLSSAFPAMLHLQSGE